jgi:hypothetical protein
MLKNTLFRIYVYIPEIQNHFIELQVVMQKVCCDKYFVMRKVMILL